MYTENQIEELLKTASLDSSRESRAALYLALDSTELYYQATANMVDGKRIMSIPLLRLQDNTHAMMVYTSKSHPDLPQQFGGAPWRHTLEIALNIPDTDWLILTNLDGNWIAINRTQIPGILDSLPSQPTEPSNNPPHQKSTQTPASTLDSLISRAVHAPLDNQSDPILDQLKGRELYVRLAAEPSADGRPVMITSKVRDIGGLVQAYTSRSRPEITYGGMTWETIVKMIENTPHIPGVHIINDNDDWIILSRSDIKAAK